MSKKVNVMLHPIRMKILQSLIGGRNLTVQQISQRLSDVPQATLYRHLKTLLDNEIINVVKENKVRGTVEKVYSINEMASSISQEELSEISSDEHFRIFFTFLMNLLGDFENYITNDNVNLITDCVGYGQTNLYLSNDELLSLMTQIKILVDDASKNEPSPERRLRTLATILLPQDKKN